MDNNENAIISMGEENSAFNRVYRIPSSNSNDIDNGVVASDQPQNQETNLANNTATRQRSVVQGLERSDENNNQEEDLLADTEENSHHDDIGTGAGDSNNASTLVNSFVRNNGQLQQHPLQQRVFFERELPHAYPVNNNHNNVISVLSVPPPSSSNFNIPNNHHTNSNTAEVSNNEIINRIKAKRRKLIAFVFLVSFVISTIMIISMLAVLPPSSKIHIDDNENDDDDDTLLLSEKVNNTKEIDSSIAANQSQITTQSQSQSMQANTTTPDNNHSSSLITNNKNNNTCFTDPILVQTLEWEAHERGDDPSILRTYHFCPHSFMKVFNLETTLFTFDYGSGNVNPLILFRPNVHIFCGEDGDYSNNCTFSSGFYHVSFQKGPMFVNYNINTTVENITIEGFRFTGATGGSNIVGFSHSTNITIKNCRFDVSLKNYMSQQLSLTCFVLLTFYFFLLSFIQTHNRIITKCRHPYVFQPYPWKNQYCI